MVLVDWEPIQDIQGRADKFFLHLNRKRMGKDILMR